MDGFGSVGVITGCEAVSVPCPPPRPMGLSGVVGNTVEPCSVDGFAGSPVPGAAGAAGAPSGFAGSPGLAASPVPGAAGAPGAPGAGAPPGAASGLVAAGSPPGAGAPGAPSGFGSPGLAASPGAGEPVSSVKMPSCWPSEVLLRGVDEERAGDTVHGHGWNLRWSGSDAPSIGEVATAAHPQTRAFPGLAVSLDRDGAVPGIVAGGSQQLHARAPASPWSQLLPTGRGSRWGGERAQCGIGADADAARAGLGRLRRSQRITVLFYAHEGMPSSFVVS
ncbi:hypothetical protein HNP11_003684 [Tsukamurella ocularis]|nr:hypothetical protein [Tsukamurella ocularis]MCS3789488.1 hypothetical protein [Tsukamurella ocularis]MCS3852635.1 hypothetical protein [Tsukamurella ocularis]